jgi:solute carrier family 35 protein E1
MKADIFFPVAIASSQLVIGLFYAIPLWIVGIRPAPKLSWNDIITIFPIVFLNTAGHVFSVMAMFQKGGGSFTHVIKASEPVVSVIVGLFMFGTVPKPFTTLSLLPITYGVAYASTLGNLSIASMKKELTTPVAMMAMAGNIAFALRSAFRKKLSTEFKVCIHF